jgi:hypothetical protein
MKHKPSLPAIRQCLGRKTVITLTCKTKSHKRRIAIYRHKNIPEAYNKYKGKDKVRQKESTYIPVNARASGDRERSTKSEIYECW